MLSDEYQSMAARQTTDGRVTMLSDDMTLPAGYEPHDIPADYTGALYIEGQMRRFAAVIEREARRQALEDAALACEQHITGSDYHFLASNGRWDFMAQAAVNCADAIRELKEETK